MVVPVDAGTPPFVPAVCDHQLPVYLFIREEDLYGTGDQEIRNEELEMKN
jgi:hypothetical protein